MHADYQTSYFRSLVHLQARVAGEARLNLLDLRRAYEVQLGLRTAYPGESHAQCHVWGIWRLQDLAHAAA